ncbi:NAD(P)-dependent dehydrogenase (short-subunit alcohol dehydrogenase family) [Tamaricihabitans halophyticus]|uniref:NAD(P)-dependent dehydrogenase (Short-subunit alcohol dehydrogenase family) n=1 Tax=Tamaricihabitans halophyticus TaxID=1262583 RepID=A0A4R2QJ07_9PSEU|nr:SDR family oxidoreductase [Tamaricihabitans halophyticus]TCP49353.1 NAD(P)-dependent dehydrogenase (short-subunit alcohol dehydrogenase family) [Tamaricihabitans halophyticus]
MLSGKVALVTGGSRGMGAAIAHRLASDGADVVLTYVNDEQSARQVATAIGELGRRALAIKADSAEPEAIVAAVRRAASEFGRLDILVNNAGIFGERPLGELTVAEIDRMLAIHVRAALLAAQTTAEYLGEGGRIISIGSNLAERVTGPGITLYATSKAALLGMTKGLARDLGPRGITANVVHPGSTDTDMNPANGPAAEGQRAITALGRYGHPDDVAATVAHLAGPGGRTITGTAVLVDGGANA